MSRSAVVAIAKDEDEYLKEWVDWNLIVGFDEVFVFQNNWRYTGETISDPRVHLLAGDGKRMQVPCYNMFMDMMREKFDYAAFFDIDEFIWVKDGSKVDQFFDQYLSDIPSLFLNWRIFGDNGFSGKPCTTKSVLERFTACGKNLDPLGKHIVNLKLCHSNVKFANPHILVDYTKNAELFVVDPLRKHIVRTGTIRNNLDNEPAELCHFRNKTWEEALQRRFGTDDAFWNADTCPGRRDMEAVKKDFANYNQNDVSNTVLRDLARGA